MVLDFSKTAKRKEKVTTTQAVAGQIAGTSKRKPKVSNETTQMSDNKANGSQTKPRNRRGRLSLATNSQDYGGSLGLPDKVVQREHETTGQFFRRLDRLVAKTKVEARLSLIGARNVQGPTESLIE